jgi:hypothetical protein
MRAHVAIILIVCGTLLASAPVVSDFAQAVVIRQALAEPQASGPRHFFKQPLEESYRLGCWILGGAMIGLGIIGGSRRSQPVERFQDRDSLMMARAAG